MKTMRILLFGLLIIGAVGSIDAFAYDQWASATLTKEESTGYTMFTRCFYRTNDGLQFSITVRDVCPLFVEINVDTNEVKR